MILPIVQLGEEILGLKSQPVHKSNSLTTLISNMFDTMYAHNGIGLAAVQVGILKRVFVSDIPEVSGGPRVFINPEIEKYSHDLMEYEEGCLSIQEVHGKVKRPRTIELVYYDQDLVQRRETFHDLFAICIQHEIDHLDGILFLERLEKSEIRKVKKLVKQLELSEEFLSSIDFGGKALAQNYTPVS